MRRMYMALASIERARDCQAVAGIQQCHQGLDFRTSTRVIFPLSLYCDFAAVCGFLLPFPYGDGRTSFGSDKQFRRQCEVLERVETGNVRLTLRWMFETAIGDGT